MSVSLIIEYKQLLGKLIGKSLFVNKKIIIYVYKYTQQVLDIYPVHVYIYTHE